MTDTAAGHSVRRFLAECHDQPYRAYASPDEAKREPGSAIVLSGDHGGTIFLTAPAHLVRCDADALRTLVSDLDAVTWMSGDATGATADFEHHPIGSGVTGGNGGGIVVDGVWTHPDHFGPEIAAQAEQVVLGGRPRIDGGLLRRLRAGEIAGRQARDADPGPDRAEEIPPPVVPFPD